MLHSINPYNQELLKEYAPHTHQEVQACLGTAQNAFTRWKNIPLARRAEAIAKIPSLLSSNRDKIAETISLEMGKPITQAYSEVDKCAHSVAHIALYGEEWIVDKTEQLPELNLIRSYDPKGIIALVMPWNFPFWQVIRCAVPALLAGNVIVLKHAPNVSGCSLLLEQLFHEAGMGDGIFSSVLLENDRASLLLSDPRIRGISLTGSEKAGSAVASLAGKNLIKSVLELGGSDPFIILPDAELSSVVSKAAEARLQNTGQSCIAAKRFIVPEKKQAEFIELLHLEVSRYSFGDPLNKATTLGPIARLDLAEQLSRQIQQAQKENTSVTTLKPCPEQGAFVPVQTLSNQAPGSVGRTAEFFGPVFSILPYAQESEIELLANETSFGLGASIWSSDTEKAWKLAKTLNCGNVFINELVKSDARWPFGGTKNSGYGKELGPEGILEFCDLKIIAIARK